MGLRLGHFDAKALMPDTGQMPDRGTSRLSLNIPTSLRIHVRVISLPQSHRITL